MKEKYTKNDKRIGWLYASDLTFEVGE